MFHSPVLCSLVPWSVVVEGTPGTYASPTIHGCCVICIIQPVPYLGWQGLHFPAFLTGLRRLPGRDRCCQTRRNIPWRSGLQGRGGDEEHGMLRTHLHPERSELLCSEGCSGPGCAQELCTGLVFSSPASDPMRTADLGRPSSAACVSPHGSVGRTG